MNLERKQYPWETKEAIKKERKKEITALGVEAEHSKL
jgi:hypothetical protein